MGRKVQPKEARKWWLKSMVFILLTAVLLFVFAGTFSWVAAWIYLALILAIVIANALAMDPELMAERSELQGGTKKWDLFLATFVAIWGPLAVLITAALDRRFGWSQDPALLLQVAAIIIFLLGGLLSTWAMAANRFFSSTVRIQEEHSHTVIDTGPYRFVRHPGYSGGIISILMIPILLQSWYAFMPAVLVILAFVVRTALEEGVLSKELTGYAEYCQRTRYRLLPGIW